MSKFSSRVAAAGIAIAVVAASCGGDGSSTAPETAAPTSETSVREASDVDLGGAVTGGLPGALPSFTVEDFGGPLQPGWTVFNVRRFGQGDEGPFSAVVMLDDAGELAWSAENDGFVGDVIVTAAGTILYTLDDHTLREVDLDGRIVREYLSDAAPEPKLDESFVTRVDVETFHHEVTELANGNLIALASETEVFRSESPLCGEEVDAFDGTYKVVADEVVEFERDTGEVVSRRSLFDVFDPFETPGTDFCTFGSPFGPFPDDPLANDWTHANAASVGPDGEIIVSIRHLDAIVAWPADPDETPLWIFGPEGTITAPPGDEFIHQHAPEMLADGSLLVYDNGNDRVDPDGEVIDPPFSRVAQYEFGDDGAELVWQYRRESRGVPVSALAVGDVDRLENGNTLIVDGFINRQRAEIAEVSPDGELLRLVTVEADDRSWLVYRAERITPPSN